MFFHDVVLQDTRPEDWPELRSRIRARVMQSFGRGPDVSVEPKFEVVSEYENYGLKHRKIRYSVLPGEYGLAVVVLPKEVSAKKPAPAVIICHGTYGWKHGKDGPLSLEKIADCGYSIELAQRGFVTVTPDNYKCGELMTGGEKFKEADYQTRRKEIVEQFHKDYPEWSFDGRRLLQHTRLVDAMEKMDFIEKNAYGVMGNSLGGRTTINLSALDERIRVSVPSTGISPVFTNASKQNRNATIKPAFTANETASWFPYDYQDLIALNAPRPLLVLEPYNDTPGTGNLYIEANFACYVRGQRVYKLLGKPECFCTLNHGDGHATPPDIRDFAYRWIERWLKPSLPRTV